MAFTSISGLTRTPIWRGGSGNKGGVNTDFGLYNSPFNKNKNASHYSSVRPTSRTKFNSGKSTYVNGTPYIEEPQESAYDRYLAQLEQERLNRVAKIKDSIRARVDQGVRAYEAQRPEIQQNYQNLKNQSEVERYNQARMLRESQANRGALDSGAGRQENLAMQNNYGNALNSINMAEQKDLNELNRAIQDLRSQGDMQMALAEADASGDFSTALNVGYQNYGDSANFANAATGIRKARRGGSAVTSSTGTGLATNDSAIANAIASGNKNSLSKLALLKELKKRKYNNDDLRRMGVSVY